MGLEGPTNGGCRLMSTQGSGASSPSRETHANEDAYLVHDGLGLYVVCDGASEGPAGEVAARTAIRALEEFVAANESKVGIFPLRPFTATGLSYEAVRFALRAVVAAADEHAELDGMATTVTLLLANKREAVIGHVGDSRAYLIRHGVLRRLTADHDLTIRPRGHSSDTYEEAKIDCFSIGLREGDTFILCTDGAEEVIEDPTVLDPDTAAEPHKVAARIVFAARQRTPDADATVVVIRVRDEEEVGWLLHSEPVLPWTYGYALVPR